MRVARASLALALAVCLCRCALAFTLADELSPTALLLCLLLLVAAPFAAVPRVAAPKPRAHQTAVRL
jgi:hypothetical protein